MEGKQKEMK